MQIFAFVGTGVLDGPFLPLFMRTVEDAGPYKVDAYNLSPMHSFLHNFFPPVIFCTKKYDKRGIFMFVRSIRMSTVKLMSITALTVLAITTLIFLIPSYDSPAAEAGEVDRMTEVRFDKIRTEDDRVNFLAQFGYTVDAEPIECVEVTIPKDFDKVFAAYNELQKGEGLDLGRYKGKTVMRYTYKVTNYEGYTSPVYANLLVYKSKVIGGDICSADPAGFAHGLTKS